MTVLTAERLREIVDYDAGTGEFRWKRRPVLDTGYQGWNQRYAGRPAGRITNRYRTICIDGRTYPAHRLAWLHVYGSWPRDLIDHINCDPADNRIENLREATNAENQRNRSRASHNKSGFKGVHWHGHVKRWVAQITVDGRQKHLGCFKDAAEAHRAYEAAALTQHGEFARAS